MSDTSDYNVNNISNSDFTDETNNEHSKFKFEKQLNETGDELMESTKKMVVKFLLSNIAAGVIIGRNGSNITELQQSSNSRIQLSRNNDFYPGTNDRVMLLSGTIRSVLTALYLILLKLSTAKRVDGNGVMIKNAQSRDLASSLKLVMPATCCGAIIGKGGETIRNFVEDSGATISVLPNDCVSHKMNHRIVSISGGVKQMLRAVALVVSKVGGDPKYLNNVTLSVNYSNEYSDPSIISDGNIEYMNQSHEEGLIEEQRQQQVYERHHQHNPSIYQNQNVNSMPQSQTTSNQHTCPSSYYTMLQSSSNMIPQHQTPVRTEITVSIPDERIGAIIGKGGEIIMQLQSIVGVKIVISARDEFEPGTRNRRVTIIGSPEAVHIAHMLISMKERSFFHHFSPTTPPTPHGHPQQQFPMHQHHHHPTPTHHHHPHPHPHHPSYPISPQFYQRLTDKMAQMTDGHQHTFNYNHNLYNQGDYNYENRSEEEEEEIRQEESIEGETLYPIVHMANYPLPCMLPSGQMAGGNTITATHDQYYYQ